MWPRPSARCSTTCASRARNCERELRAPPGKRLLRVRSRLPVCRAGRSGGRAVYPGRRHRSQPRSPVARRNGRQPRPGADISFTHATLRFRPPTRAETAISESAAGAMRALGGAVSYSSSPVGAGGARPRPTGGVGGHVPAGTSGRRAGRAAPLWEPAPRFWKPPARSRWPIWPWRFCCAASRGALGIAGVLGAFHGLYFRLFLQTTGYHAGYVLGGAAVAELALIAILGLVIFRLPRLARKVAAGGLLVFGLVWFALRLRS